MSKALCVKRTDALVTPLTDVHLGDLVRLLEEEGAGGVEGRED